LTDSKRTTQSKRRLEEGSLKSLRYQPTPPFMDSGDSSPAFQAFGTDTGLQPSVDADDA
jgi:hypothetical protein